MNAVTDAFDKAQPVVDADDTDHHRNIPRPSEDCLYGLIGNIARAASDTTEANPFAVAANTLAYVGCALGRGPYLPVGNTWHHANIFTLHVGRSGEGRKGDAVALPKRIAHRVGELSEHAAPQIHTGGLSSREGLAFLIHDGYKEGREEIPAIQDKRLLVIESEFANVLAQGRRDGNTLSSGLRDCWDGVSLKPATKGNRLWASNPHVCLSAAITPSELLHSVAARDLTNGFMNRFLPFWAERTKMMPFPQSTPPEKVNELAGSILDVLDFCGATRWVERDHLRMEFSPSAAKEWALLYRGELNDRSHGERINSLIERRAPMLLRIAMIFALCDQTTTIDEKHIYAAAAWVRYSVESVKFIFGSATDEAEASEINATASKITEFLRTRERVTRTQITSECFRGHANKTRIDAALEELLTASPPRIVVTGEQPSGQGRPAKFYTLAAKEAKEAKNEERRGLSGDLNGSEESETCEEITNSGEQARIVRILRAGQESAEPHAGIDSSHRSHTSHGNAGDLGVEI